MLVQASETAVNLLAQDDFGIVYFIQNAQQFWSELDDLLRVPAEVTLSLLDTTLRRFVSLCASYHEQYLQSPLQLEHACQQLLNSELFTFHSERMCELIIEDAQSKTDPHVQLILYTILLYYGRRQTSFLRSSKRWKPLIPLLIDHVLVEIDPETEFTVLSASSASGSRQSIFMGPVTIEAKLRCLGVRLLYEVCRVQNLSAQDLRVFTNSFIDYLFDLVEQTRFVPDETFNYSVIKLLVALNEQFMVAGLDKKTALSFGKTSEVQNRVVHVLTSRLGSSKTFGANMIFMLNRASQSTDDLCMQLLVLKLLYILFTSKATSTFFYTNDLCVLVDVFLRELVDLGEENESLRQTYLRVLHPLLTKTQLRDVSYKRPQIVMTLESLIRQTQFREVNPTTKRLVERCLSGEWCMQMRKSSFDRDAITAEGNFREGSPSQDVVASTVHDTSPAQTPMSATLERSSSISKPRQLKSSRSIDNLKATFSPRLGVETHRRPSVESAPSFGGATSGATGTAARRPSKSGSMDSGAFLSHQYATRQANLHTSPSSPGSISLPPNPSTVPQKSRRPPPPPPVRRKSPPTAVGMTNGGAIITAIASSSSSVLKKFGNSRGQSTDFMKGMI
ncbi:hypothetical protein EDD17DRAFT_1595623 [Pisolithus thermaeus]|nr:hypothetical protein EV401DRAFT_200981 [Pisolithus croceorrhizus]KAI6160741.1 hypothetical protein EDD17DRAFT_1595623 [Pisolithus thermaeus]